MANPLTKDFSHLLTSIQEDLLEDKKIAGLYIADDDGIFEKLLVQPLIRNIRGKDITFLGVRNVVLKEEFKGKGLFTSFVDSLENLNIAIMFHDVVNDKLVPYFYKRRYTLYKDYKYEQEVLSFYKLAR